MVLTLAQARANIEEVEEVLEQVDDLLSDGTVKPVNDGELARVVGISISQLGKVREYIITGRVSLDLGNCTHCGGWGGWDDISCSACLGTGNVQHQGKS